MKSVISELLCNVIGIRENELPKYLQISMWFEDGKCYISADGKAEDQTKQSTDRIISMANCIDYPTGGKE